MEAPCEAANNSDACVAQTDGATGIDDTTPTDQASGETETQRKRRLRRQRNAQKLKALPDDARRAFQKVRAEYETKKPEYSDPIVLDVGEIISIQPPPWLIDGGITKCC